MIRAWSQSICNSTTGQMHQVQIFPELFVVENIVKPADLMSVFSSVVTARASVFCSIFPSPEQQLTTSLKPAAHNTGGSLPDLTNIQFPPPLPTPLDSDDAAAASFSSSNSTQTLANTQGNGWRARIKHSPGVTCSIFMTSSRYLSALRRQFLCVSAVCVCAFTKLFPYADSVCWVGVNTSQPTVTMEMQPGQDDMVPLILNAGDSHQLSPTSPPLTLSQVQPPLSASTSASPRKSIIQA